MRMKHAYILGHARQTDGQIGLPFDPLVWGW